MVDEENPQPDESQAPPTAMPPSAPEPPAAPSAPPPPTGGSPYQPPPAQGYQPYGAPPPVPVGYGLPGAKIPGQIDPETGLPYSDKERLTAGLLQLLPLMLGVAGIGRLYTGHTAIGVVMLVGTISGWVLTCVLIGLLWAIPLWIWGLIDGILMLTNRQFTDAQGRVLR